jgi:hypothetical protein
VFLWLAAWARGHLHSALAGSHPRSLRPAALRSPRAVILLIAWGGALSNFWLLTSNLTTIAHLPPSLLCRRPVEDHRERGSADTPAAAATPSSADDETLRLVKS